ncbi:MAG: hypothetical protein FJ395_21275 [Verrucomicrobia bacterium]|nr:hypothetical protein [Verrucomicrobiota bacterium]
MAASVRVTHPFHPLLGQTLDFVERRVNWGDDLLFYRDHRGYVTALPTRWTSLQEEDPFLVVSAGRSHFQVGDLIGLTVLITELKSEKNSKGGGSEV